MTGCAVREFRPSDKTKSCRWKDMAGERMLSQEEIDSVFRKKQPGRDDAALKAARLALLTRLRTLIDRQIGDLSHLGTIS